MAMQTANLRTILRRICDSWYLDQLVEVHLVEAHLVDLHMWYRRRQGRVDGVAWSSHGPSVMEVMYSLPGAGHVGDLWKTRGIQFLSKTRTNGPFKGDTYGY